MNTPRTFALLVLELTVPVTLAALVVFIWQKGKA